MQNQGIKPTEWTYTAKAKVESSVGAFDDALRTTQQMQAEGITPRKSTWQVILSMAQQMGRPDVIRQVRVCPADICDDCACPTVKSYWDAGSAGYHVLHSV